MTVRTALLLAGLVAFSAASQADDAASAPAKAEAPTNRVITKIIRSVDGRRDWEGSYAAASATRKINLFCLKSDTGRCGFRVIDAHKNAGGAWELQVDWFVVAVGATAERTLKGESYAVCVRPDVGRDEACEPTSALTAF